jgi:CBS-domain-containing membrane protein
VHVQLASDLSRSNPYYSVMPETSLLQVAEIFSKGIHRVAVTDGAGGLKGILTQSNFIHYLAEHMFEFKTLMKTLEKTLDELQAGKSPVFSVQMEAMVVDALEVICKNGVSSVAVVDQKGHLFGNISLSDIKHVLQHHKQSLLYASCAQLVAHVKMDQGAKTGQDTVPVFDIHTNNTLRLAMRKVAATRAHRLWVTDQQGYVEGVVTLTDIIQLILNDTA